MRNKGECVSYRLFLIFLLSGACTYGQIRVIFESITNQTPYNLIIKDQSNQRISIEALQTYNDPITMTASKVNQDAYIGIFNGQRKVADLLTYVVAYSYDTIARFMLELNEQAPTGGYKNLVRISNEYPRDQLVEHEESWIFRVKVTLAGEKLEKSTITVLSREIKQRR